MKRTIPCARRPTGRVGVFLVLSLLPLTGCSRGVVHTVPVMRADLPPGEPLIQTLPIQESYYWIGADGQVSIAMRFHQRSLLGPAFETEWVTSLVLDHLPAGRERLYKLTTTELRMVQNRGPDRRRGRSFSGIVVLEAPKGGRLKARFHVTVQQQVFSMLHGWGSLYRGPVLTVLGECVAQENAAKGLALLARTEADGMSRSPQTRPVAASTAIGRRRDGQEAGGAWVGRSE